MCYEDFPLENTSNLESIARSPVGSSRKILSSATLKLVLINVLIFIILSVTGTLESTNEALGTQPAGILGGQVYRMFTSMFLHGDLIHLLGNMLALWVFGYVLEKKIGTKKFLAIYFLTHLGAVMFDIAIRPESWISAYGASAAISGLIGACLVVCALEKIPLSYAFFTFSSLLGLVFVFVMGSPGYETYAIYILISLGLPFILFMLAPFASVVMLFPIIAWLFLQIGLAAFVTNLGYMPIGWWAHLSGFLAGFLLTLYFVAKRNEKGLASMEIPSIQ